MVKRSLTILSAFCCLSLLAEPANNGGVLQHRRDASRPKASGGGGSITFGAAASNTTGASSTTATVQLTSVSAGHLIAVFVKHEGAPTTITVSDGTTSLTGRTKVDHSNADLSGQWFYLLSSVASGTVTYTATFGAARAFKAMHAFRFSYTGTAAYDSEPTGGGLPTNPGATSHTTGTTWTTAQPVCVVLCSYVDYSGENSSSRQINGVAETGNTSTGGSGNGSVAWYRILSSTFASGAGTCTTAANAISVINGMGLNAQ